jgi:hypothetical protein
MIAVVEKKVVKHLVNAGGSLLEIPVRVLFGGSDAGRTSEIYQAGKRSRNSVSSASAGTGPKDHPSRVMGPLM